MTRLERLKRHLEGGGNVCPFARSPGHTYVNDEDIGDPFRAFASKPRGNRALLIVARDDPGTVTGLRTWANRRFLKLSIEAELISSPDVTRQQAHAFNKKVIAPALRTTSVMRAFLNIGKEPITPTVLAPIYPPDHPRYAPVTCLSLVWFYDIAAMKNQPFVAKIRGVMLATHGELYDADELVLPLPKELP